MPKPAGLEASIGCGVRPRLLDRHSERSAGQIDGYACAVLEPHAQFIGGADPGTQRDALQIERERGADEVSERGTEHRDRLRHARALYRKVGQTLRAGPKVRQARRRHDSEVTLPRGGLSRRPVQDHRRGFRQPLEGAAS